jgi:hypothetical protein
MYTTEFYNDSLLTTHFTVDKSIHLLVGIQANKKIFQYETDGIIGETIWNNFLQKKRYIETGIRKWKFSHSFKEGRSVDNKMASLKMK